MLTIVRVDGRELLRDHHNMGCILTEIRTALLLRATAVSTSVMLECWIPPPIYGSSDGQYPQFFGEGAKKAPLV